MILTRLKERKLPALLLSGLIEEFIDSLRWSNCSLETVNSYRKDLTLFLNHLPTPESFQVDQLTQAVLENYFSHKSQKVKPTTLARYQSSLRSFCRWLIKRNYLLTNPFDSITNVKVNPSLPKAIKKETLKRLFAHIKKRTDWIGKRDYALFLLLYQSGLRVSEALALSPNDLDFQTRTLKLVGKGGVEAISPFSRQTARAIRAYLRSTETEISPKDALFLSYRKCPLSYRQVHTRLTECAQQASIGDLTPHMLRHSFCTHLLQSGRNLREIQLLARHKSIQNTQRYLDLSIEQATDAFRASEKELEV
jgi:integrase/recombinase XerC